MSKYYVVSTCSREDDFGHVESCEASLFISKERDQDFYDDEQGTVSSVESYETFDEALQALLSQKDCARSFILDQISEELSQEERAALSEAGLNEVKERQEKYYGFIQSNHGADHVFVFTEDQLQELFDYYGEDMNVLPTDPEETAELDGFPMGGSNSGMSVISLLETKDDVLSYLQQDALGPDSEDPYLVDMAEYYWGIDDGEYGCGNGLAARMLREAGFDVAKVEEKAMKSIEEETQKICDVLGIPRLDFYGEPYEYMRTSDIHVLGDIKDLLNTVSVLDFENSDGRISLNAEMDNNGVKFYKSLTIEKTNSGEYDWKFTHRQELPTRYSWANDFNSQSWETDEYESAEIFNDLIQKAIEEKDPKGLSKDEEERE